MEKKMAKYMETAESACALSGRETEKTCKDNILMSATERANALLIGIIVGSVVALLCIAACVFMCCNAAKKKKHAQITEGAVEW